MSSELLQTKLFVPRRPTERQQPALVSRTHLIEKLNQGLQQGCKLSLISAPAGFGKTTLLTEWVAILQLATANRVAWLSLDEADSELPRFLTYVVAALDQVDGREATFGQSGLRFLQLPQPSPAEVVLTALINEIADNPNQLVLVLDDYHHIHAPAVDEALAFLLDHLPPQMHLVIATRDDPHLPFSRLRVRGQLMELRAADLRFSLSETAEFLNQVMGLTLSVEDVAALERRTEGWIAGLQLAALALQGHISLSGGKDSTKLIQSFSGSHRFVMDYLIEEVLEQQSAEVQRFLLQTAVLDQLAGSLCDTLTGQHDGQETLEMLEHANLFIIPLDEERHWYRYHHLFADLLRQRLRQSQPENMAILQGRASEWYDQNGFVDEAIKYALRAEAFEQAADLIEKAAETVWGRGEDTKLRQWLDTLPTGILFAKPQLCIFHAWSLLATGQQDAAERSLHIVDQVVNYSIKPSAPGRLPDADTKQLRGRAAATRAFIAFYQGNVPGMIQFSQQALEHLPQKDAAWRSVATNILGDAYDFQGEVEAAYPARLEGVEASKAAGNCYQIIIANLKLALTLRTRGQLAQVVEICQQQLYIVDEYGNCPPVLVGWLMAVWGEALAEMNDLDGAIRQMKKGIALVERGGDLAMIGWSYICLIRVLFTQRDFAAAEEAIQKMEYIDRDNDMPAWITNLVAAWRAKLWLAQGKLETAVGWAEERKLTIPEASSFSLEREHIILARILMAQGRHNDAARLLQRLLTAAKANGRTARVIEILLLQALISQAEGDMTRAITVLSEAIAQAEPGGFIRTFVDEGQPMAELLSAALGRGDAPSYVKRLLAAFPTAAAKSIHLNIQAKIQKPKLVQNSAEALEIVEPLSERELEVLQRISEGLTNREIAERLYLSLNTVKVHTRNIYGKLGVHNRTQAAAKARELGIL
ncbi:LuxR C-terminal-related transcriptional regulator [Candidatus Leptofilum sp.]|uniref:LuxR C-terminal-related transcriptional regulator n=1 Tax=Candidatus Leptofilum sp. TaxID=3241576 RepID=UPI003B59497A